MILRILQFFFGCGHFANLEDPNSARIIIAAQCVLRTRHRGPHQYLFPGMVERP